MLDENKYMIMVGDYNQEIRPKNKEEYEENDDLSEIAAFEPAFAVRQSEFHNCVSGSERDAGSFR